MDSKCNCRRCWSTKQRLDELLNSLTSEHRFFFFLEKYWINPQYFVRLNFIDDDDDDNLCTMIIALMQKETRQRRLRGLDAEDYIQYRVFKVKFIDNTGMHRCFLYSLIYLNHKRECILVNSTDVYVASCRACVSISIALHVDALMTS